MHCFPRCGAFWTLSLDYDYLMGLAPMETIHDVRRRDTILYALGVSLAAYGISCASFIRFLQMAGRLCRYEQQGSPEAAHIDKSQTVSLPEPL